MKNLSESLFDQDIVQKDIPGHKLKDIAFFDGQWVYRYQAPFLKTNNALEVIDWNMVRKDLKKYGGDKIDLGLYAYANADQYNIRNAQTNKKTEMFAKLIMSIPYICEYKFASYNAQFRDEFLKELNKYIFPDKLKTKGPFHKYTGFYFDLISDSKFGFAIVLKYGPTGDEEYLRFEFVKYSD